jgi:hypothetical protein
MYLWKQRTLANSQQLEVRCIPPWFRILLLAIAVASLAAAAWAGYHFSIIGEPKPSAGYQDAAQSEIMTVSLCELLANPAAYDLRVIRVPAILVANDGASLYDPACITMEPMVAVEPDVSLLHEPSEGIQKQFFDLVQPHNETKGSARMVMIGRFEGPNFVKDGRKSRFQHQFILMRIEAAELLTLDPTVASHQ